MRHGDISTANSGINFQSGASRNSTGLSSREANAISIVVGEISPLLLRYERGVTIFKHLLPEKLDASINFIDEMVHITRTLQQQVVTKLCELKSEFETWERSILINNNLRPPTKCDRSGDSAITHINNRIDIGNKILSNNDFFIHFR